MSRWISKIPYSILLVSLAVLAGGAGGRWG